MKTDAFVRDGVDAVVHERPPTAQGMADKALE